MNHKEIIGSRTGPYKEREKQKEGEPNKKEREIPKEGEREGQKERGREIEKRGSCSCFLSKIYKDGNKNRHHLLDAIQSTSGCSHNILPIQVPIQSMRVAGANRCPLNTS
jgi:hypothetical protein